MQRLALVTSLVLLVGCRSNGANESGVAKPDPNAAPASASSSRAAVGQPAPDFELADIDGKKLHLHDYAGKVVVLEWFNPDCPFVKRNHTQGPLKTMAKDQMAKGIVWLSINSNAPGKQGSGADKNREGKQRYAMENPILLDERGDVGKTYGAKSTPGMYVIDAKGTLVYRGAIDNAQDGDPPGGEKLVNYVEAALADVVAGRPVAIPETPSYGCSVKYGS